MGNISCFKELVMHRDHKENMKFIWWFNIGIESLWDVDDTTILPHFFNKKDAYMIHRTEQLCMLLADSKDIVIMRESISDIISRNMQQMGLEIPEIWIPQRQEGDELLSISELILRDDVLIEKMRNLKNETSGDEIILVPYAVTHLEEQISKRTGYRLLGAANEITSWVNSKVNARMLAVEVGLPVTQGYICHNAKQVETAVQALKTEYKGKIAVKEAYGASGKGFFMIDSDRSLELLLMLLNKQKNSHKNINLIVEKWYDTWMDINYQVYIHGDGNIHYIPPKRQIIIGGIYIGSEFPITHLLTEEQNRFYEECASKIGQRLWEKGYRGIASIDSIIVEDGRIFPVVEINGRFTLSTYTSLIPDMLGKDKFYKSKYYNFKGEKRLQDIWNMLQESRYTPDKGEGIIIYSYAQDGKGGTGRLFALFTAVQKETLSQLEEEMDSILLN